MKELAEIKAKGTPDGIDLISAESNENWLFTIQVLGDETVYRVSVFRNFQDLVPKPLLSAQIRLLMTK